MTDDSERASKPAQQHSMTGRSARIAFAVVFCALTVVNVALLVTLAPGRQPSRFVFWQLLAVMVSYPLAAHHYREHRGDTFLDLFATGLNVLYCLGAVILWMLWEGG